MWRVAWESVLPTDMYDPLVMYVIPPVNTKRWLKEKAQRGKDKGVVFGAIRRRSSISQPRRVHRTDFPSPPTFNKMPYTTVSISSSAFRLHSSFFALRSCSSLTRVRCQALMTSLFISAVASLRHDLMDSVLKRLELLSHQLYKPVLTNTQVER
ncbi:hypothetical protein VTI74DRAFT_6670 [Chaetomium olivicolor]